MIFRIRYLFDLFGFSWSTFSPRFLPSLLNGRQQILKYGTLSLMDFYDELHAWRQSQVLAISFKMLSI